ncbi:MAG: penicillin acylase family protein, partial [Bacteroidales bacterium]|nr:penicillin acylase family protein [Bacteroidales bacterium]
FINKIAEIKSTIPIPEWIGSNSWVLAPQKTESGKVFFANDTHIGYAQPSVWYEAHIEFPGFKLYGNHIAGIPFALLGHNQNTAWGMTMFENDDTDLFREKLNPENENQVWFKDHWEDLKIENKKIKVKGGQIVDFQLKISRHGPIMNQTLSKLDTTEAPIAVWWTYTQVKSDLFKALYSLDYSKNIDDARKAVSLIHAPGLNIMYGDKDGNIAWWAAAKLVKRAEHINPKLILDGSSGNDEYLGFYDFTDNPQSENPPCGYVYSANNQPDTIAGILYPGYYAPENRAKRINQLLNNDNKWNIDKMKVMITDAVSSVHPDVVKTLFSRINKENIEKKSGNYQKAYELLEKWDGNHLKTDIAPTIYYKLLYNVLHNTFADEIGENDFNYLVSSHLMEKTYPSLFKNENSPWWDNIETENKEISAEIIENAFISSIDELEKQLGENINEWKWEKVHTIEHVHPIGRKAPFDKIFNVGPFNVKGGNQVINNLDFHLDGDGTYEASYGPAIRILLDFSDIENSISVLPTGESGRFMSKHYDDQTEMYNEGIFRKQMMNKEEILSKKEGTLVLKPVSQ